jgi:hypothetical protein
MLNLRKILAGTGRGVATFPPKRGERYTGPDKKASLFLTRRKRCMY